MRVHEDELGDDAGNGDLPVQIEVDDAVMGIGRPRPRHEHDDKHCAANDVHGGPSGVLNRSAFHVRAADPPDAGAPPLDSHEHFR